MKKIVLPVMFLSVFCLYSCTSSDRIYFADPKSDPSVYHEYSLYDVLSDNIAGEDAYESRPSSLYSEYITKYFHIVSEVYIRYDRNKNIVFFDSERNSKSVADSRGFDHEYDIDRNGDYDPSKIYRVKYTLIWSLDSKNIKIDSIEGLLTYSEYEQLERKRRAERIRQTDEEWFQSISAQTIDKTLYEESTVEDAFAWAVNSNEDTIKKFKVTAVFYQNTGSFLIFTGLNGERLFQFGKTYRSLDSTMKGQIVTLYFRMRGSIGESYGHETLTWYRGRIDDFIYQ
jgi:hypothetical protein